MVPGSAFTERQVWGTSRGRVMTVTSACDLRHRTLRFASITSVTHVRIPPAGMLAGAMDGSLWPAAADHEIVQGHRAPVAPGGCIRGRVESLPRGPNFGGAAQLRQVRSLSWGRDPASRRPSHLVCRSSSLRELPRRYRGGEEQRCSHDGELRVLPRAAGEACGRPRFGAAGQARHDGTVCPLPSGQPRQTENFPAGGRRQSFGWGSL